MAVKPTKLRINELKLSSGIRLELRADFDNDRHHVVLVEQPSGPQELARALIQLGHQIASDKNLQDQSI